MGHSVAALLRERERFRGTRRGGGRARVGGMAQRLSALALALMLLSGLPAFANNAKWQVVPVTEPIFDLAASEVQGLQRWRYAMVFAGSHGELRSDSLLISALNQPGPAIS